MYRKSTWDTHPKSRGGRVIWLDRTTWAKALLLHKTPATIWSLITTIIMKEVWKKIKGYEGMYEVSNLGRVKSFQRKKREGRQLSPHDNGGYLFVTLSQNGFSKVCSVHRLVAIAFIPNPKNKPQINHKNFQTGDNYTDNLEWCTASENIQHSLKYGKKGKRVRQILNGQIIRVFKSITLAAVFVNKTKQAISLVCRGGMKTCAGYEWEFDVWRSTLTLVKN